MSSESMEAMSLKWDIDFTLALHNRTGKYFLGRDIIDDQADLIGEVYAWRIPIKFLESYIASRVVGRLWSLEVRAQEGLGAEFGTLRSRKPLVHMDPLTVLTSKLRGEDLVLCHDMGPVTHPDLFTPAVTDLYRRAYAKIAARRPRMVFVSKASEQAFTATVAPPLRSRVIYPPLRSGVTGGEEAPVPGIATPFLLTVGSLGHRKNQAASIEAYARSGLHETGFGYVLCGSREPGWEAVVAAGRATPGVHVIDYVSDAQLRWLYHKAAGFVLASRLEGFGVPVAEAISQGLVPLVTRDSVLEEVAGPAALLTDAEAIDEIAARMRDLVTMSEAERGRRQVELGKAVERFSRAAFREQWRTELAS